MLLYLPSFADKRCPPIPEMVNAQSDAANETQVSFGSLLTFTCKKGHLFPGNTSQVAISCQDNFRWNKSDITGCIGKIIMLSICI